MELPGREPSKEIASTPIEQLTSWLETALGARTVAYAADLDAELVGRVARGDEQPDPDAEARLRNLYAVVWFLESQDGPDSAYEWLVQPNPDLDDRTPLDRLRGGDAEDDVWFAAAPELEG